MIEQETRNFIARIDKSNTPDELILANLFGFKDKEVWVLNEKEHMSSVTQYKIMHSVIGNVNISLNFPAPVIGLYLDMKYTTLLELIKKNKDKIMETKLSKDIDSYFKLNGNGLWLIGSKGIEAIIETMKSGKMRTKKANLLISALNSNTVSNEVNTEQHITSEWLREKIKLEESAFEREYLNLWKPELVAITPNDGTQIDNQISNMKLDESISMLLHSLMGIDKAGNDSDIKLVEQLVDFKTKITITLHEQEVLKSRTLDYLKVSEDFTLNALCLYVNKSLEELLSIVSFRECAVGERLDGQRILDIHELFGFIRNLCDKLWNSDDDLLYDLTTFSTKLGDQIWMRGGTIDMDKSVAVNTGVSKEGVKTIKASNILVTGPEWYVQQVTHNYVKVIPVEFREVFEKGVAEELVGNTKLSKSDICTYLNVSWLTIKNILDVDLHKFDKTIVFTEKETEYILNLLTKHYENTANKRVSDKLTILNKAFTQPTKFKPVEDMSTYECVVPEYVRVAIAVAKTSNFTKGYASIKGFKSSYVVAGHEICIKLDSEQHILFFKDIDSNLLKRNGLTLDMLKVYLNVPDLDTMVDLVGGDVLHSRQSIEGIISDLVIFSESTNDENLYFRIRRLLTWCENNVEPLDF